MPSTIPRVATVLTRGWPFLLPVPVLIFTLVWLLWEPAKAGMFSVLVLMVAGYWFARDKSWRWWIGVLSRIGRSVSEILAIAAVVGLIIGSAAFTGLGFTLSLPLLELGQMSLLLFLVVTALISIVLGMGLPGIAIYFMQVALIVPSLVEFGIDPLAAHFFIYYFGVFSFITPPVCIAAIASASLAQASPMRTGWESVKLGIVAFIVPFAFVLSPSLLAQGEGWRIALNVVTAALGVLALSVSLRGFLADPVPRAARVVLLAAGTAHFLPAGIAPWAWVANGMGFAVVVVVLGVLLRAPRAVARES